MATRNSKHPDYFYAAFISDIHLGAQNTQTRHIIQNLDAAFPNDEVTAQLDCIYIAGDVFDRALLLTDPQVIEIKLWIYRFLRLCAQHRIQVRVLKGTPSHDWNQNTFFEVINKQADIGCDLIYHDKLEIEHQDPVGLNVLYIPDEWRPTTEAIWEDVQEKLMEKQLKQVDLTIMHGMFGFQLPEIAHLDKHTEERYLELTRLAVVCGHVHQANQFDRIWIPGSYDRLCHGDEGKKSHLRMKFYKDESAPSGYRLTQDDVVRIPNPNPKVYETIDCSGLDLEEALSRLKRRASELPDDSHLRIKAEADHPVIKAIGTLRGTYPLINWSTKRVSDAGRPAEKLVGVKKTYEVVQITDQNIGQIVGEKLSTLTDDDVIAARSLKLLDPLT